MFLEVDSTHQGLEKWFIKSFSRWVLRFNFCFATFMQVKTRKKQYHDWRDCYTGGGITLLQLPSSLVLVSSGTIITAIFCFHLQFPSWSGFSLSIKQTLGVRDKVSKGTFMSLLTLWLFHYRSMVWAEGGVSGATQITRFEQGGCFPRLLTEAIYFNV